MAVCTDWNPWQLLGDRCYFTLQCDKKKNKQNSVYKSCYRRHGSPYCSESFLLSLDILTQSMAFWRVCVQDSVTNVFDVHACLRAHASCDLVFKMQRNRQRTSAERNLTADCAVHRDCNMDICHNILSHY